MSDTYIRPTLTDGNVCLRQARQEDVDARIAAGNHAEIQHMYAMSADTVEPVTQSHAESWVAFHMNSRLSWFIDIDDVLSGVIFLHSYSKKDKSAKLAMGLLRADDLGQGYGTRALHLLLGEVFDGDLGLHRLSLRVLSYNTRAIAVYEKAGFQIEGRERQSARVVGKWHDDVMMGLLAPEWKAGQ